VESIRQEKLIYGEFSWLLLIVIRVPRKIWEPHAPINTWFGVGGAGGVKFTFTLHFQHEPHAERIAGGGEFSKERLTDVSYASS